MATALEHELASFQMELPRLLSEGKEGRFALIHDGRVDSDWETEDQALQAGYDRLGLEPFLVMEITEHQKSVFFSRNIKPCR